MYTGIATADRRVVGNEDGTPRDVRQVLPDDAPPRLNQEHHQLRRAQITEKRLDIGSGSDVLRGPG